jgi:nickel superoxide dismutase
MGLDCCGIGNFYDNEVAELLKLNQESRLLYLVAVGPIKSKKCWLDAKTFQKIRRDTMKNRAIQILLVLFTITFTISYAAAHCEIPCGIYDDEMRISIIAEHITTIERSMKQIVDLEKAQPINYNQLVRWVMNKEAHANKVQEIVTQYFMTQRIKPDHKNYEKKLIVLQKMLISAMNCKQTTRLSDSSALRSLLKEFHDLYFGHGEK